MRKLLGLSILTLLATALMLAVVGSASAEPSFQGDFDAAQQHFEECLQIRRQQGDHCDEDHHQRAKWVDDQLNAKRRTPVADGVT